MARTVLCPEEVVVVSKGKEDIGRLVALGNDGKFDPSVIPVIDDLQTQITDEVAARTEADEQLQANFDAEILARTNADAKLQSNVDAEASARAAADIGLQDQIDVLKGENAFSNVLVNGTIIAANSRTDTIELAAGTNIALAADSENKKVTISVDGTVASAAIADSVAWDNITGKPSTYTPPVATVDTLGGIKQGDGLSIASDGTISVVGVVPVGTILPYAGDTAPSGYLLSDGSAVSRTTYSDLYAVIGTTYGSGDGSTTFNLPNMGDKFLLGKGSTYSTLAATGGEATHTLTSSEMPSHTHTFSAGVDYGDAGSGSYQLLNRTLGTTTTSASGGDGAHNNMPPYLVCNYIIKY